MGAKGAAALFRYRFGNVEFDESRLELRVNGVPVVIQRKPLEVLALLCRHADEVVTREFLIEQAWEGRPTVEQVVANAIAKLRTALGKENAARITTQVKAGYRLTGPIERMAVGRQFIGDLQLEGGLAVPGRAAFRLEDLLSRSNNSEVWLARDPATSEARVFKFCSDGARLDALKREVTLYRVLRESLGERGDIARIISWNFGSTPFFLECEYAGQNLLEWSHAHLGGISLAGRIGIFLQIADVVAAAHGVGVLHKDLKPANILISPAAAGWSIRLTDFGSGRLLEPRMLEELGVTRLGLTVTHGIGTDSSAATPMYMAPEVIAGHAATMASDVYALGLILYQLVVGDLRKPLTSGWERGVPDALLQEDIRSATDGDTAQRLSSAALLTERLRGMEQRREERQRVQAAHRIRQRLPWMISLVATLLIGLLVGTLMLYREGQAREQAERGRARAQATSAFLGEVFSGGNRLLMGEDDQFDFRKSLDRGTRSIPSRFDGNPATEARVLLSAADTWIRMGDYPRASSLQERAAGLLAATLGAADVETIEARHALARSFTMNSEYQRALQQLYAADEANRSRWSRDVALELQGRWVRGMVFQAQMRPSLALAEFEQADRLLERAEQPAGLYQLRVKTGLAWCYTSMGRPADAMHMLEQVLGPQFAADQTGLADWAITQFQYASTLTMLGRFDEALDVTVAAAGSIDQQLGSLHYLSGLAWNQLASVFEARGDRENAGFASRHAYETLLSALGPDNRNTRSAHEYMRKIDAGGLPEADAVQVSPHASGAAGARVAGHWFSNSGFEYDIVQTDKVLKWISTPGWTGTGGATHSDGGGQVLGRYAATHWTGPEWAAGNAVCIFLSVVDGEATGIYCSNGIKLFKAQPARPGFDLSGHWDTNIGFEYDFVHSGNSFTWKVTRGAVQETGRGTLQGARLNAEWTGSNGTNRGRAVVIQSPTGDLDLYWSNGVIFHKKTAQQALH
jgi:non-specific serine/threonine protein kinase